MDSNSGISQESLMQNSVFCRVLDDCSFHCSVLCVCVCLYSFTLKASSVCNDVWDIL